MKQPQSRERRRQVDRTLELPGDLSGTLEDSAYFRCSPAMDVHECGTELGQDGELGTRPLDIRRLLFVKGQSLAEMSDRLTIARPMHCLLAGCAPVAYGLLDQSRFRAVSGEHRRPRGHDLRELAASSVAAIRA